MANSFTRFEGFSKVGALLDSLSNAGVHETILEALQKFASSQQKQADINTLLTYSDPTISNFLRIL